MPRTSQEICDDARAHTDKAIVFAVAEARQAGYEAGRTEEREDVLSRIRVLADEYVRRDARRAAAVLDFLRDDIKRELHLPDGQRATAEMIERVAAEIDKERDL